MPKFTINFRVEQTLNGSIDVDAPSAKDAMMAFSGGAYDEARLAARLDLDDSEDTVVEIISFDEKGDVENVYVPE